MKASILYLIISISIDKFRFCERLRRKKAPEPKQQGSIWAGVRRDQFRNTVLKVEYR